MQRGDVVRVQLPAPQGRPGREQFGARPAIVVQTSESHANLGTVVVVPLTSNQNARRFDGSFVVLPSATNGLSQPSVVLTQQVRAIDKSRIQATIGVVSTDDLNSLDLQLRRLLGL